METLHGLCRLRLTAECENRGHGAVLTFQSQDWLQVGNATAAFQTQRLNAAAALTQGSHPRVAHVRVTCRRKDTAQRLRETTAQSIVSRTLPHGPWWKQRPLLDHPPPPVPLPPAASPCNSVTPTSTTLRILGGPKEVQQAHHALSHFLHRPPSWETYAGKAIRTGGANLCPHTPSPWLRTNIHGDQAWAASRYDRHRLAVDGDTASEIEMGQGPPKGAKQEAPG